MFSDLELRLHATFFVTLFIIAICLSLTACTSSSTSGKPVPAMTFDHMEAVAVNVRAVDVVNNYSPGMVAGDVSASFPTPPDMALRRWAESRLYPAGGTDVLKFVIEDASVTQSVKVSENGIVNWLGADRKDHFVVNMVIGLFTVDAAGYEGPKSELKLMKTITIPQKYPLAQKEKEKFDFLELMMQDVDEAVTRTLQNVGLSSGMAPDMPVAPAENSYPVYDDYQDDGYGSYGRDNIDSEALGAPQVISPSPEVR